MLTNDFINQYKNKIPPWGPIGYLVYKRTYARLKDDGTTEEWFETVARCVNGLDAIKPGALTIEEQARLYDDVFNLRCCFSGRALWQLGTHNVQKFGGDSLQNCWQVAVNDPIKPFCFAFNELMLGGGVGFNITPEFVYELPTVKYNPTVQRVDSFDCDYIIPDNREGWVNTLGKILKSFFYSGKDLSFNTNCIRPKGKPIHSFGGVASGSEDLVNGYFSICKIISKRHRQKLRPIDCLDIMNIIGKIVIAGNVRRSAQLALGDIRDHDFLNAKNWGDAYVPNWRCMSNNSVVCNHYSDITEDFWSGYNGEGEAYGLVNLNACRKYGRLSDGLHYRPDEKVTGLNPCAEITLEPYEACNLGEIFLPNIYDNYELMRVSKEMYKVCKIISTLPFIYNETREVVSRNHRIGLSLGGFMQSEFRYDSELFNTLYTALEMEDLDFSNYLGVRTSNKLTTMKPSGTLSLLAGVTHGAHAAFAPYYIRRVRMSSDDPALEICKASGYNIEPQLNLDGTPDYNTMVVNFPIKTDAGTVCEGELSATDQLQTIHWLQKYWADNSVSCTVKYEDFELGEIQKWLRNNYEQIKAISFMPKKHGFLQAPMEEITEEKYYEMVEGTEQITKFTDTNERELSETMECDKGGCPIK